MKKMTCLLFCLSALIPAFGAEEGLAWIDKEMDLRIQLNRQYKIDYAEGVQGMSVSKELVPLELAKGQEWVDYLTYVRKHQDVKLKIFVLRLELQQELANYYYDLEYAESPEELAAARKEIAGYKQKLEDLKKAEAVVMAPAKEVE